MTGSEGGSTPVMDERSDEEDIRNEEDLEVMLFFVCGLWTVGVCVGLLFVCLFWGFCCCCCCCRFFLSLFFYTRFPSLFFVIFIGLFQNNKIMEQ